MEARSRFGPASERAWCWCWQGITLPDRTPTGQHGELYATTEMEAIDRLREAFPNLGPIQLTPDTSRRRTPAPLQLNYFALPGYEREQAWRDVWHQLTTAAGSESIVLGWAGMSPAEAMKQVDGRLLQGPGPYCLADADLQSLLNLAEHPPGPDEMAPGGGGLWQPEDEDENLVGWR
jgi:hypothetical protein